MSGPYRFAYLLLCCSIGCSVWAISYGIVLQVIYQDARILQLTLAANPLVPFQQLMRFWGSRSLQVTAVLALVPAVAVSATAIAVGLRRPSNPLGDAAFQDLADLRRAHWFRRRGIIVGCMGRRILRRDDDRHHLVIGPTRSGKSVGYVIPNALTFPGSMIITDLKGEIFQHTAGYRKAMGHSVFLFAPGDARSHRWNPLDFVRSDRGSRSIDLQNMASILVPETAGSENAVWQATAQQVIAGVISYVLESPYYRDRRNLGEVNAIFNCGVDLQELMRRIKETEPDLSRFTVDSFNAYIALNERAARSALLDIQKAMLPFRNERVLAATSVTDIDLAAMRRRPVSIYLAPRINDMTILRPLLTLFVQQSMELLTLDHDPQAVPAFFLLDEFRQLKKMDELMNKLPYVAGYNIKIAFIIQDLKNIDGLYGETARHSLLGNCGLQLILGANDQATADYASRALGKRTLRYSSETRSLGLLAAPRRTRVEQVRERDLMMPQEVRQMPSDKMVVLVEGQKPILASKLRSYAHTSFRTQVAYAVAHQPDVPATEFAPRLPVPAADQGYGRAVATADANFTRPPPVTVHNDRGSGPEAWPQERCAAPDVEELDLSERQRVLEMQLERSEKRLRALVEEAPAGLGPAVRRSVAEILAETVPDPAAPETPD
ncbi:type IV secretory system conjugative DNA transfer family protein [Pseudorhizobium pelagicum]|uniref:Conjugal transfer protein TraG n=1 Tax=Pseudorhizobium pelagicum TaxID=1509405 RepID=A0A922T765_9HYPH|nr:type IV secretory system conjugative DNA transfer family protein [Pseudorhizobium pelagicum]KEQ04777.1 conjugal transfer protein TraG [Pseudorhizobium pelagicum]KEQ07378.1 conjugal transfer protein TraG [Pseudorhizobium pelagicum]